MSINTSISLKETSQKRDRPSSLLKIIRRAVMWIIGVRNEESTGTVSWHQVGGLIVLTGGTTALVISLADGSLKIVFLHILIGFTLSTCRRCLKSIGCFTKLLLNEKLRTQISRVVIASI